jgi:hypothetical protein
MQRDRSQRSTWPPSLTHQLRMPSRPSPLTLVETTHGLDMMLHNRLSGADTAESGPPFQPPSLQEAARYAHKPLPPLPPSSYFRRNSLTSPGTTSAFRTTSPGEDPACPDQLPPPSPRHRLISRRHISLPPPPAHSSSHHASSSLSSRKIMQITGHQLDMTDSSLSSTIMARRLRKPHSTMSLSDSGWAAFGGSAWRMGYLDSRDKDEYSSVPPLLEADRDGSAKSRESWEPASPDAAAQPAPWVSDAAVAETQHEPELSESDSKVRDLFQLHSLDLEVALSYHTIASELAVPKRPVTSHAPLPPLPRQQPARQSNPKTLSLTKFLHSDPSRRLRSALPAIVTSAEPRPARRSREQPRPLTAHPESVGARAASRGAAVRPSTAVSATHHRQQQQQRQQRRQDTKHPHFIARYSPSATQQQRQRLRRQRRQDRKPPHGPRPNPRHRPTPGYGLPSQRCSSTTLRPRRWPPSP